MEVTNGLLSNLVETKSMEMVLAPIASQVSQLIMLCESKEAWNPNDDIRKSAETVKEVIDGLIETAKKKMELSNNQSYASDMLTACDLLAVAGESFYLSSLGLQSHFRSTDLRRRVIQAAKDVLQGTMKVLLIADEAEVKAIERSAGHVRGQLQALVGATNMTHLVKLFRTFTEAVVLLTSLSTRRQKELVHPRQREKVIMGLGALKKAVPLLNVALQGYVKHTDNSQAKASRDYAVKQIQAGLTDITDAVMNRFTDEDYLGLEDSGFFVARLDQLLESLTEVGREEISGNFELWTQDVVAHSMSVAHLSTETHRDIIINNCQRILHQKGRVCGLVGCLNNTPNNDDIRSDYDEVCECLIDEFCDLERYVNMATLHLIVSTFWRTTEALDDLAKSAIKETVNGKDWLSVLNDHIVEFGEHADKVCQVASLAAASSTDSKRVRCIRLCIHRLEQLDPEIVPAAVACLRSAGDKLAVQHMRLLKEEWRHEFEELLQVLDDMTDPRIFMEVTEEQLTQDLNACNGFLVLKDIEEIVAIFPSISGKTKRVIQIAKHLADDHEDPLYRNGLMVYVERLKKVVVGTADALLRVKEMPDDDTEVATLKRRLHRIPEGVGLVREALNKTVHPDILSPLRVDVRQSKGKLSKPNLKSTKDTAGLTVTAHDRSLGEDVNVYMSNPPPYWSKQRVEDEQKNLSSLSLTESPKTKEMVSSSVQCNGSLEAACQTNQSENRDQQQICDSPSNLRSRGTNTPVLRNDLVNQQQHYGRTDTCKSKTELKENRPGEHPWQGNKSRHKSSGAILQKSALKGNKSDEKFAEDKADMAEKTLHSGKREQKITSKLSPALRPRVRYSDSVRDVQSSPSLHHSADRFSRFKSSSKRNSPISSTIHEKAALPALRELDNPIVKAASEMSRLNNTIEQFAGSPGKKVSFSDLLKTAKSLSSCGQIMVKHLHAVSTHCLDNRFAKDLSYHMHHVSMATVQLDIISSVSVSSPDDRSTDEMMLKTARRLMEVTAQALRAAENASLKGLKEPDADSVEYVNSFLLLMQWKDTWQLQRHLEAGAGDKDELGLRRMDVHNPPALAELLFH